MSYDPNVLIGHTGFLGQALLRQGFKADILINSKNLGTLNTDQVFNWVIIAAPSAEKWKANLNPEEDRKSVQSIIDKVFLIKAKKIILISTIDVYADTSLDLDEEDDPLSELATPYGYHRGLLENSVLQKNDHYTTSFVFRLPALFGEGLKKNALYDLLNRNNIDKINCSNSYKWYNVDRIYKDILYNVAKQRNIVNFFPFRHHCLDYISKNFKRGSLPINLNYVCKIIHETSSKYDHCYYENDIFDFILKEIERQEKNK